MDIIQKAITDMLYSSFIPISSEFHDKLNTVPLCHGKRQGISSKYIRDH